MPHLTGASASGHPRYWLHALALATSVVALGFTIAQRDLELPLYDFAEYWAAGRLFAAGANPYDAEQIGSLERAAGRDGDALLMWNPPWTLPLVLPFGLLPPRAAHLLWLALHFLVVLASADAVWRYYGGSRECRGVAWMLAFLFTPTFLTLYLGQISALLLAGAVLFLHQERRGHDWSAGAATVLLAIKPHLFALFWLALLLWTVRQRRWRIGGGAASTLLAATLIALLVDPAVLAQYWQTLTQTPPAQYHSPTLGTVLRLICGEGRFGLQFLAVLPGLVWFVPMWRRYRACWDWGERLPVLLLVSLLTAPYGAWPFDSIVLLVPLLGAAAGFARESANGRVGLMLYLTANLGAALCIVGRVDFFWWLWLNPLLLLAHVLSRHRLAILPMADGLAADPIR